jgi:hypothetical protein
VTPHLHQRTSFSLGRLVTSPLLALLLALGARVETSAQAISYRGFLEGRGVAYPQDTPRDTTNLVADALARGELFARPLTWLGLAAGVDARANTHDQIEDSWRLDIADRSARRPRLSVRRLSATMNRGPLTVDVGKQFIRWGKADILTPTDRFAPRDYLNVIDPEFLGVRAVRAVVEQGSNTFDVVWVPFFTPSRLPLLDQRWSSAPPDVQLVDVSGSAVPEGSQAGVRWGRTGTGHEYSLSFYDGFNHLPNIESPAYLQPPPSLPAGEPILVEIVKRYPTLRMFGGDVAIATRWFTAKGEFAYFTTTTPFTDEYALYVLQLERQSGEWLFVGGYAGEIVTELGGAATFSPDRGIARTILGRASYTIDVNRSVVMEGALRQNGRGLYLKGEYSQARGQRWRATVAAALIRGEPDDFLGQYRLNSHLTIGLRYSF